MNLEEKSKQRIVYLDYLRIFSFIAIVTLHVSAQNWFEIGYAHSEWKMFNLYDSMVRWGVPVFLMISGTLFLKRTVPMKMILKKYVLRMVTAFLFWSVVYFLFSGDSPIEQLKVFGSADRRFAFGAIFGGASHMWFVPMIAGLYILLPVAQAIADNKAARKVFITFSILFAVLIPFAATLCKTFGNEDVAYIAGVISGTFGHTSGVFAAGMGLYFILGLSIEETEIDRSKRIIIYILGAVGLVSTFLLTQAAAVREAGPSQTYYGYLSLNVFMAATAIFTLFKYAGLKAWKIQPVITYLSKCCFGGYLVHVLVLTYLRRWFGLHTLSFYPMLSIPLITVIVAVVSLLISAILNQIPGVKKYLV